MTVYVIGTADTKAAELAYAKACVIAAGAAAILVDVGTRSQATDVDVTAAAVAAAHPRGAGAVLGQADRGVAITAMAEALTRWLSARRDVDAVLGLGGSGKRRSSPPPCARSPSGCRSSWSRLSPPARSRPMSARATSP
jgi:uncharacterized protein (UPF0261 family)